MQRIKIVGFIFTTLSCIGDMCVSHLLNQPFVFSTSAATRATCSWQQEVVDNLNEKCHERASLSLDQIERLSESSLEEIIDFLAPFDDHMTMHCGYI